MEGSRELLVITTVIGSKVQICASCPGLRSAASVSRAYRTEKESRSWNKTHPQSDTEARWQEKLDMLVWLISLLSWTQTQGELFNPCYSEKKNECCEGFFCKCLLVIILLFKCGNLMTIRKICVVWDNSQTFNVCYYHFENIHFMQRKMYFTLQEHECKIETNHVLSVLKRSVSESDRF